MKAISEVVEAKPKLFALQVRQNFFVLRLAFKACNLFRNKEEEKVVNIDGKTVEFLSIEEKMPSMLDDDSKQIKAEVRFDDKYYYLNVTVTEFNNTAFSIISAYSLTERKNSEPF